MTGARISEPTWRAMPWHPRAQLAAKLDAEVDMLAREVDRLTADLVRMGRLLPSPEYLRWCHAAWERGERDDTIREGERAYQRERKRRARGERATCEVCGLDLQRVNLAAHARRMHPDRNASLSA